MIAFYGNYDCKLEEEDQMGKDDFELAEFLKVLQSMFKQRASESSVKACREVWIKMSFGHWGGIVMEIYSLCIYIIFVFFIV